MELRRALQENAIARTPLLNARYEKKDVRASSLVWTSFLVMALFLLGLCFLAIVLQCTEPFGHDQPLVGMYFF